MLNKSGLAQSRLFVQTAKFSLLVILYLNACIKVLYFQDDKEALRKTESAGSPLAFTPTSVMRKTAAERKDSDGKPAVPELKISVGQDQEIKSGSLSPGRPIKVG